MPLMLDAFDHVAVGPSLDCARARVSGVERTLVAWIYMYHVRLVLAGNKTKAPDIGECQETGDFVLGTQCKVRLFDNGQTRPRVACFRFSRNDCRVLATGIYLLSV